MRQKEWEHEGQFAEIYDADTKRTFGSAAVQSANKQPEQLVKRCIAEFEKEHGHISDEIINEMYSNR